MISFNDKNISGIADIDTVAEECKMAIICPCKRFYPNKNYGSFVRQGLDDDELAALVNCALRELDGAAVLSVSSSHNTAVFNLIINDEIRSVSVNFE